MKNLGLFLFFLSISTTYKVNAASQCDQLFDTFVINKTTNFKNFPTLNKSFFIPNERFNYESNIGLRNDQPYGDTWNRISTIGISLTPRINNNQGELLIRFHLNNFGGKIEQNLPLAVIKQLNTFAQAGKYNFIKLPSELIPNFHWNPAEKRHNLPVLELASLLGRLVGRSDYIPPTKNSMIRIIKNGYQIVQKSVDNNHKDYTLIRTINIFCSPDLINITGFTLNETVNYPDMKTLTTLFIETEELFEN